MRWMIPVMFLACSTSEIRTEPFDGAVRVSGPQGMVLMAVTLAHLGYFRGLASYGLNVSMVIDQANPQIEIHVGGALAMCARHDFGNGMAHIFISEECASAHFLPIALSHELVEAIFDPALMNALRGGEIADVCEGIGPAPIMAGLGVVSPYMTADGECFPH